MTVMRMFGLQLMMLALLGQLLIISCVATGETMVLVEPTETEARFWQWLRDQGVDTSNIVWPAKDRTTGSRGVMALGDIVATDPMHTDMPSGASYYIKVPKKLMITPERVLRDEKYGQSISWHRAKDHSLTDMERTALFLIFQLNDSSAFFHPYVKMLDVPSLLVADWPAVDLIETQDERLVYEASKKLRKWYDSFLKLSKEHYPPELFTWERFKWAMLHVNQRTFGFKDKNGEIDGIAMIPGADLLNHGNWEALYKVVENKFYVSYPTERTVRKGDECLLSYGQASNSHLLLNYAFALKGNRYDTLELESDSMKPVILQDLSAVGSTAFVNPGQSIRGLISGVFTPHSVIERCIEVLGKRMQQYATTLTEDMKMLGSELPWKLRFALYYRIGQKVIGQTYLRYCLAARKSVNDVVSDDSPSTFDLWFFKFVRQVESVGGSLSWFDLKSTYGSRLDIVSALESQVTSRLAFERGLEDEL